MIQFTEKDNSSLCEMAHCIFIIVIISMNNDASIAITHTSTDCHRSCCISYTTGAPQLSCYTPAIFITVAILLFCLFVWRTIFSAWLPPAVAVWERCLAAPSSNLTHSILPPSVRTTCLACYFDCFGPLLVPSLPFWPNRQISMFIGRCEVQSSFLHW